MDEEYSYWEESKAKRRQTLEAFIRFGIWLVMTVIFTFGIIHYVVQRTSVEGDSMNNTLIDGDSLLVDKISYRFRDIERFDIVVFPYRDERLGEVYYIKRVIGLPGETVRIENGKIYIDDEELKEDYGYYEDGEEMKGYDAVEDIFIGDNEYFVMGDNRNKSRDSRQIGCISGDSISGRAFFRIFPFGRFGTID